MTKRVSAADRFGRTFNGGLTRSLSHVGRQRSQRQMFFHINFSQSRKLLIFISQFREILQDGGELLENASAFSRFTPARQVRA